MFFNDIFFIHFLFLLALKLFQNAPFVDQSERSASDYYYEYVLPDYRYKNIYFICIHSDKER